MSKPVPKIGRPPSPVPMAKILLALPESVVKDADKIAEDEFDSRTAILQRAVTIGLTEICRRSARRAKP